MVILIACPILLGPGVRGRPGTAVAVAQEPGGSAVLHEPTPPGGTPSGEPDIVIPAGQEELLGEMLGQKATLPDGCQLVKGDVEYRVVKALYKCPAGEVAIELSHPTRAAPAATRTDRFAITVQSGSPPDRLIPALEARIRSREATFEWQIIEPSEKTSGRNGPPSGRSISWVRLALAALFVIAIAGWIARRRGAGKKAA